MPPNLVNQLIQVSGKATRVRKVVAETSLAAATLAVAGMPVAAGTWAAAATLAWRTSPGTATPRP